MPNKEIKSRHSLKSTNHDEMKTEQITSSHIAAVLLKILGDISYYLTYLFVHCFVLKISRGAMTSAYILFVYSKSTLFYKIIITAHNTNSCFIYEK